MTHPAGGAEPGGEVAPRLEICALPAALDGLRHSGTATCAPAPLPTPTCGRSIVAGKARGGLNSPSRSRAPTVLGPLGAPTWCHEDRVRSSRRTRPVSRSHAGRARGAVVAHIWAVTALLDRLERPGWAARERHPEDRRKVVVRLMRPQRGPPRRKSAPWCARSMTQSPVARRATAKRSNGSWQERSDAVAELVRNERSPRGLPRRCSGIERS
jgi:hypothetical protein